MRSRQRRLLGAVAPKAQQGTVDGIIDKAVATYNKTKTSKGTFDQAITNPLTGSTVKASGAFEQQRQPARFSFRFVQPKGDMIIGDGKSLWVYLPSSTPGQVIKVPMTEGGAGSLDLASRFFDSPKTRFTITDAGTATIAGRATRALLLKPKASTEAVHASEGVDRQRGRHASAVRDGRVVRHHASRDDHRRDT